MITPIVLTVLKTLYYFLCIKREVKCNKMLPEGRRLSGSIPPSGI